jgi:CRP/FNR family transcriptional regulator, cyclic AMP receptor protein
MARPAEERLRFLIADPNQDRTDFYSGIIKQLSGTSVIYTSMDGLDTIFKVDNAPPHVLIIENVLPKLGGLEVAAKLLNNKKYSKVAIIIVSSLPEEEHFVDEVVTGQVQFLTDSSDERKLRTCLNRALNFVALGDEAGYRLRFLNPDDILFNEGEKGDCAYIVKKGELEAIKDSQKLGNILAGEFVGEMSHFNGEPRSATIKAITNCELIQIPFGSLDGVLFAKPAWSKALVMTLTKRLKNTNILKTDDSI